jgi:DNA anti-recombination protein RmuC
LEIFMKARTALLTLIVLLIVFLATMNWQALNQSTPVSLGFTTVEAPLGLIMLCLTALLAIFFVAYVVTLQGSVLMETRRHNKEMLAQRELADKAEASRFTELRTVLELRHQEAQQQLLNRLDALEEQFKARAQESDNSTAAYVGQLEQQLRAGVAADWGSGKGHAAKPAEGRADPLL